MQSEFDTRDSIAIFQTCFTSVMPFMMTGPTDDSSNISSALFSNASTNNSSFAGTLQTSTTLAAVIAAVSFLLGIPANITVMVKLSLRLHGSSISQRLFFSLAVSDILCLLCLPFGLVIVLNGLYFSHAACRLYFYFFIFCITSDLNILVLISIQRYYQVLHPEKWEKLNRTWQRLLLSAVWILGALEALPVVFSLTELKNKDEPTDGHHCKNQRITPALEAVYIMFVVFCNLVLFCFYLLLVRGVNQTQMSNQKKPRVTKLFIRIIAASLVVGFFPLIARVFYLVAVFTESEKLLHVSKTLTFVESFYFFSHFLNPFLYFFASRHHKSERNSNRNSLFMPLNDNP